MMIPAAFSYYVCLFCLRFVVVVVVVQEVGIALVEFPATIKVQRIT